MQATRSRLKSALAAGAVAAATLFSASGAQADLLDGNTIQFQYLFPDINTNFGGATNYLVGAGVEIPNGICCGTEGSVDFSDHNILVDFSSDQTYTTSTFNGFRITDVFGTISDFTSASINAISNLAGLTADRVTFDANNIWINWQGLSFTSQTVVSIDIGGGGRVPEPGSLALVGLAALAALGAARRARR